MTLASRRRLLPWLALTLGCSAPPGAHRHAWIVVDASGADGVATGALDDLRLVPAAALQGVVRSGSRAVIDVDPDAARGGVRVDVRGACPLPVEASEIGEGHTVRKLLAPRVDVALPEHPQDLGYDAPFRLVASLRCTGSEAAAFSWRQVSGPALGAARPDGPRFEGRTPAATPDDAARRPAWGIVPVSARASAEVALEVTVTSRSAGAEAIARRTVIVAAASRSHGLPNVALDEGVLLAGAGWQLHGPPHAAATLRPQGDLSGFVPDVAGEWLATDAAGHALAIHAGRYDETPLDCGRAPCHASIAAASAASPMTAALHSLEPSARGCASPCHATGGASAHDGGFGDLAREMGVSLADVAWEALPTAMRQVGGVTCLGCHGPGAIPESSARWAVLRADVCATCHDAPPTYGHVAAWRSSRMARSDADPRARSSPECARCHTTSGFLASLTGKPDTRAAPPGAGPLGIACAACHAPHEGSGGAAEGEPLLRAVPAPTWGTRGPQGDAARICVPCHSPVAGEPTRAPSASAAVLWAGTGGIDPASGRPLSMSVVHGGPSAGCLGCHDGGPAGLERGANHAFHADPQDCARCHTGVETDAAARDRALRAEATSLLAALSQRASLPLAPTGASPTHASPPPLPDTPLGRAAYDVLLVLEDPAAGAHNEPFARALLAAARTVIQ